MNNTCALPIVELTQCVMATSIGRWTARLDSEVVFSFSQRLAFSDEGANGVP